MYICQNCKSTNIVNADHFQAYFRGASMLTLRSIFIYHDLNSENPDFIASCPELSLTATAAGKTELEAITKLGKVLQGVCGVTLLGKKIE